MLCETIKIYFLLFDYNSLLNRFHIPCICANIPFFFVYAQILIAKEFLTVE